MDIYKLTLQTYLLLETDHSFVAQHKELICASLPGLYRRRY